jgi:monovalent cation/proton antiporter MnhG/PhaG subunit
VNAQTIIVVILLALAVALSWLSVFGLLVMRNPFDRLHAIAPLNILPPIFVVAAILVSSGFSSSSAKLILIAIVMIATGPVLTHAMGRAARICDQGRIAADKK